MSDGLPNLNELEERHDGFAHGYRMRCDCGGISPISAAVYGTERTREAMMDCNDCGVSFNFGPAVAAIRDPEDPALDNGRIGRMAWYHTSTAADWPSSTYADDLRPALEEAADRFWFLDREHSVERHLRKALHVGTYEAAIENMLRRMDDQADADSTFYLHRVALKLDPIRINVDYRDETDEEAAQITTDDLRRDGLDAIRYLNVHEAIGSLSLAVLPETITAVQTIKLPVEGIGTAADQPLLNQIDKFEARLTGLQALEPPTTGVSARELRLMQLGLRPDPEGIGRASEEHTHSIYDVWRDLEPVLTAQYLAEVSPVVAGDFRDALADWRRVTDSGVQDFARWFAAMAALLTHGAEVRRAAAAAPAREPRYARSRHEGADHGR